METATRDARWRFGPAGRRPQGSGRDRLMHRAIADSPVAAAASAFSFAYYIALCNNANVNHGEPPGPDSLDHIDHGNN
jgi:hypothetical protein